jgi:hypothetical protein
MARGAVLAMACAPGIYQLQVTAGSGQGALLSATAQVR